MLQTLSIKNVALITNLNIEFNNGFNVLLGETGAGKSIIFDSLNFVLGAKADKSLIRSGENEMRVDAIFCNLSETIQCSLSEFGFEGEEIVLSRTLTADGRSTIRINGLPSVQSVLKSIGSILVDSYSQHESVELLKTKNHLSMLDKFGGDLISNLKSEVEALYHQEKEIIKKIEELGGNEYERERVMSLLEYQINEIENANLVKGEDQTLSEQIKYMQSAEKIYEAISSCEQYINDGSTSSIKNLYQGANALSSLSSFTDIFSCKERLDSLRYELEDIMQTLSDIKAGTDFDEREFERLDKRLDIIKAITKKYGGSIENALEFLKESKEKFNVLQDSEFIISKLQKDREDCLKLLTDKCQALSSKRKEIARDIESKITDELKQLGMKSSSFQVSFDMLLQPSINGMDKVEFIFSANKGQELKALSKTASGGELSRFMLAIKNIFNQSGDAQTLIFDEIDSGISGETGNIVGQKLNNISKTSQVLCITHLPQVACFADSIYFVSKKELENTTQTEINLLHDDDILTNLAKMVVGDNVSETALKQAKEMRIKAGKIV